MRLAIGGSNFSLSKNFASNTSKPGLLRDLGSELPRDNIIDRRSGTITSSDSFERNGYTATDDRWNLREAQSKVAARLVGPGQIAALSGQISQGLDENANQLRQGRMTAQLSRV